MATIAGHPTSDIQRERRFFFRMAVAMSIVIVAGFAFNLATGRSTFAVPLLVHVHAFVYFGWVALYLTQNYLVVTGQVALHRRLGPLALVWIPAMIVLGLAMTRHSLQTTGGPFFFDQNEFLFGNSLGIFAFAGVALWGIAMRTRSDWHRRLMCSAMAALTGPGIGRIMPMPLFIPWGWWIASVALPLIFVVIGIIADQRRTGRAHPAWFWAAGLFIASQLLADAIAYSPIGYEFTRSVVAGTPGAARDIPAYLPAGLFGG